MAQKPISHYEIELMLREMMETAKTGMIEANDRALRLSLVPSADPVAMKAAGEVRLSAQKLYWLALRDFTDYVIAGTVPQYLRALDAPQQRSVRQTR